MATKPTLPSDLPAKVLRCIQLYDDPNTRISKRMIAALCRLEYNATTDRQIREAVAELRKRGYPICSDSGRAGYYYNPDHIEHTIAELKSRAEELFETARALERGRKIEEVKQLRFAV